MESEIATLLRLAKKQISYCKFISDYPKLTGYDAFDVSSKIDSFYKRTCNAFFDESLLIIASLLDDKDKRVVSFWNWSNFLSKKRPELEKIKIAFDLYGFKEIRNQITAHMDFNNSNNKLGSLDRRGIIRNELIDELIKTQEELIKEFYDYTKLYSTPYDAEYFNADEETETIKKIMDIAKPKMSNDNVI